MACLFKDRSNLFKERSKSSPGDVVAVSGVCKGNAMHRCLVTGASRGIGRVIATTLREAGYDVIGLAHSRPADWVGDFVEVDLAREAALEDALATVADLGQLWGLVNNAAVGGGGGIATLDHTDFR